MKTLNNLQSGDFIYIPKPMIQVILRNNSANSDTYVQPFKGGTILKVIRPYRFKDGKRMKIKAKILTESNKSIISLFIEDINSINKSQFSLTSNLNQDIIEILFNN